MIKPKEVKPPHSGKRYPYTIFDDGSKLEWVVENDVKLLKTAEVKKENPPKLRKGQRCWLCKKEIKGAWCYNGLHWWHVKCMEKETAKRIRQYLRDNKND